MTADRQNSMEYSSLHQPIIPNRVSSRNAFTAANMSNQSKYHNYPNANATNTELKGWQSSFCDELALVFANEPWVSQRVLDPPPPLSRSSTRQCLLQQDDDHKSPPLLQRSNAIRVKRGATIPSREPETLPEHPQAILIDGLNRLAKNPSLSSPLPGPSKRARTMTPVKSVMKELTGFGKRVFSRTRTEPVNKLIQTPKYTLRVNHNGQVPLLTLHHKRHLRLKDDPLKNDQLILARERLQGFRAAFKGDLPKHRFPRGQDRVNVVARYLMTPCSTALESSQTVQLVRYSDTTMQAWRAYSRPDDYPPLSRDSMPHERWNVIEARRRVRKHNQIIECFNASWDAWVSAQSPAIQKATRRAPGSEELQADTPSPFRDFYNRMLIACDEEIQQRQDIGEALILQYPADFPGFKKY
ncbi:hypothetical protein F5Y14DRAFT_426428 [Nemania sp. NC0429]|nr:hypothetical protein F5Y14DRAFT_426428 [Nemania sp. NC0429]